MGCWRGYSGDEYVEYRFDRDGHSVVLRDLTHGGSFNGQYDLDGSALTLDFGEEPPTYSISLTATELKVLDLGFVYTRTGCGS